LNDSQFIVWNFNVKKDIAIDLEEELCNDGVDDII
jgi:hypothetical protein